MSKKIILYILTLLAIFVFISDHLFAQQTKRYDYKDFTGVRVGWGMDIEVSQSNDYVIEVNATQGNLDRLIVEKKGKEIRFIIEDDNHNYRGKISIKVKMPVLTAIGLSGGSTGNISMNAASKDFDAQLSGGSDLNGNLTCGDIEAALSGGSTIALKGKAGNFNAAGSGGSEFKLKNFSVKNVEAALSGGSEMIVSMDGVLNSNLSGESRITYYGNARVAEHHFSGGSEIVKGD